MIDWNLALILSPMIILAVGLVILMVKEDNGPTERERILEKTINAMLEAAPTPPADGQEDQP